MVVEGEINILFYSILKMIKMLLFTPPDQHLKHSGNAGYTYTVNEDGFAYNEYRTGPHPYFEKNQNQSIPVLS
jgi:hypothetical protein